MPFPLDPNAPGGPSRAAQLRQAFEPRPEPTVAVAVRTTKGAWTTHVLRATDPFEIARGEL